MLHKDDNIDMHVVWLICPETDMHTTVDCHFAEVSADAKCISDSSRLLRNSD